MNFLVVLAVLAAVAYFAYNALLGKKTVEKIPKGKFSDPIGKSAKVSRLPCVRAAGLLCLAWRGVDRFVFVWLGLGERRSRLRLITTTWPLWVLARPAVPWLTTSPKPV
jgi:hypothetical protein